MKLTFCAGATAALVLLASQAPAQQAQVGTEPGAAMLAMHTLPAKTPLKLSVSSPAFKNGGDIPFENTSYRGNHFPGLSWSKGPYGSRTFAIIMQDDDAVHGGQIVLHWTMYDVPMSVRKLDPDMSAPPAGASYGPNIMGAAHAYMGPHTPPGPKHHYHFQVFALDAQIAPAPIKTYADLTAAMNGHVLASGEVVGLAQADPNAAPRPQTPQSGNAPAK